MTQRPIPVQLGCDTPWSWDDIEERQREHGENASQWLLDKRRPALARDDVDWAGHGLEPRWVGFDTADCAAALAPSIYHGEGADEFDRFREGAASRGETALVISPIGIGPRDLVHRSLFPDSASVDLGHVRSRISGQRLGLGARVRIADQADDTDRQLALRLLSLNPAPRWYSLELSGVTWSQPGGQTWEYPAQGELLPIIETELGEPVVAAWVSADGVERRYIVPEETPWPPLLSWLVEQALPEFVPGAMRRARRDLASDPSSMTRREREARAALSALETEYRTRKTALTDELVAAENAAAAVRDGLLYGTGARLAESVRAVLESADVAVVDVDELLGDTKNADLLCTHAGRTRLVEVKSASGNAPERAFEDPLRHLREWPHLPNASAIDGGALIISHQLRVAPQERTRRPYGRPEFLAAQSEPVVTTLALFDAWREEDWPGVRRRLFGEDQPLHGENGEASGVVDRVEARAPAPRRGWFGWRK